MSDPTDARTFFAPILNLVHKKRVEPGDVLWAERLGKTWRMDIEKKGVVDRVVIVSPTLAIPLYEDEDGI